MHNDYDPLLRRQLIDRIRDHSRPLQPERTQYPPELTPVKNVRAVIFDIYGTLFVSGSGDIGTVSEHMDRSALQIALDHVGLLNAGGPWVDVDLLEWVIREDHAGHRSQGVEYPEVDILAIWRRVLERLGGAVRQDQVTEERVRLLAVEYECRTNPVWPMPGLQDVLTRLNREGMQLGIVSNAQFYTPLLFPALAGQELETFGFALDLCAFSFRLREAKPSIRLFQEVLSPLQTKYAIAPSEVLYVGNDVLKDIWPAQQLGLSTALFAGDRRSLRLREDDARCANAKPDVVINDLRQLAEVFN